MSSFKTIYTQKKLTEGIVPPHILMPLEQIVSDGQVTNNIQIFLLADLTQMFRTYDVTIWPRELNSYQSHAGAEEIEGIKTLSPHEHVQLAKWILDRLQQSTEYWDKPECCSNIVDWIHFVLKKNDD